MNSEILHDHAARVIGRYFGVRGSELLIGGLPVTQLAEQFGTPLFVYDQEVIRRKIRQIRSILPPRFQLYYSIKANPNAAILAEFLQEDCGLEVASGGELYQALACRLSIEPFDLRRTGKDAGRAGGSHRR